jgi:TRAP-type C4-dicarboxylate transport system permease small subunit
VNFFKNIDEYLGMILMAFIVLLACANVFMRYVIGAPWGWVEEVTIFAFVWLTMFGAAAVINAEGHCAIDVIARKLPPKGRRVLDIIVHLTNVVTLVFLIWYGFELAMSAGGKTTPMLGIPYTYVDLAIPVGCALMLLHYGKLFWYDITGKSPQSTKEE